jgi:hypothetical protein
MGYGAGWTVFAGPPSGEQSAARHKGRYSMKLLVLVAVLVALVLPASASATVTPFYPASGSACVVITVDGAEIGDRTISVSVRTPSGRLWTSIRFQSPPGDYPRTTCVPGDVYQAEGGFGWAASAKAGGISLGSTVF